MVGGLLPNAHIALQHYRGNPPLLKSICFVVLRTYLPHCVKEISLKVLFQGLKINVAITLAMSPMNNLLPASKAREHIENHRDLGAPLQCLNFGQRIRNIFIQKSTIYQGK